MKYVFTLSTDEIKMNIVEFAIKRPTTILMIFLGVTIFGFIALFSLPVELMPNASFGNITIFIEIRGGMPATEVETLVTKPVEEVVSSVTHIKDVISHSKRGRSIITLEFEPGTNMDFAALEVRERIARIKGELPQEIEKPVIAKYEESDVPIVILAVTGRNHTPEELRKIVDEKLKNKLIRIDGVANVEVVGGREEKVIIDLEQSRLQALNIPIKKIVEVLDSNNLSLLSGEIEREKDKYLIRTMGEFKTLREIQEIPLTITEKGAVIRLKDVANIKKSYLEHETYARLNTRPVVSIYIQKETNANTIKVARGIKKVIKEVTSILDQGVEILTISNQAIFIKESINNVKKTLFYGAILATLILLIFLRDLKSTLIIVLIIPLSVMITFICMYLKKISINIISLSGLALGIGMLIDNSIVVLENIFKKREKIGGIEVKKSLTVLEKTSIEGTKEMILPIVASTITTIIVFIPISLVNKQVRLLYSDLALTVTFSLLASLITAIIIVPLLLSKNPIARNPTPLVPGYTLVRLLIMNRTCSSFKRCGAFYRKKLLYSLQYRYRFFISLIVIAGISFVVFFAGLKKEYMGGVEQNEFTIFIELPTGTKLDISNKVVREVEELFYTIPELKESIKSISSRIEGWSSKIYVKLRPLCKREYSIQKIMKILRLKVNKIGEIYDTFIYFSEQQQTKEVTLDIYGYDYAVLKKLAVEVAYQMQRVSELSDVKLRYRTGQPEMRFKIDKQKAAFFGLGVKEIAEIIHAQIRGLRATHYHTQAREIEAITRLGKQDVKSVDDLKRLTITTPGGTQIYLAQIATFDFGLQPSEIWRKDKNRMIQVSADRGKLPLGTAVERIRREINKIKVPKDYFYEFSGDYEQMIKNEKQFKFAIAVTIILIFMTLASLFESYIQPLIIMITTPMAIIGTVFFLLITYKPISMGVFMGLLMLGGVVVNNAIILVDRINFIRKKTDNLYKSVVRACQDRLRPIFMTTLTTVLGLLPMALDRSAGANLWSPLAITVIGGLLSATVLTLFIIPGCYLIVEDIKKRISK